MTAKIIQEQAEELKDQWRKLVNAYYTTPLQWDGDEGAKPRKELKRWGKEYVRKIKALAARAEQVPVDPMPFLKEISLEVLAYTFKDQPVYRKDGTLDEDKSEGKVRWDFHHGEGFGTMGIAIAQLLMGTNDGVAKSARARDEAFAALRDAVEPQGVMEAPPTNAAPKPKTAKEWPDLKSLALFHALRNIAGDRTAGIVNAQDASDKARAAGFVSQRSGKELLGYYQNYAVKANNKTERMAGTRIGDVLTRYDRVIPMLKPYPPALQLAREERKELQEKADQKKG